MANAALPFGARVMRKAVRISNKTQALSQVERSLVEGYLKPVVGDGRISIGEAKGISRVVKALRSPGPIIEIGTLFGFSTTIIAIAKEEHRKLITVDSFQWSPINLTSENQKVVATYALADAVRNANVEIVRADKDEFFRTYKGPPPSMVFIDADHEYLPTLSDINEARRLGAEIICGHDYRPEWPGVIQAVEESGGAASLDETFWVLRS